MACLLARSRLPAVPNLRSMRRIRTRHHSEVVVRPMQTQHTLSDRGRSMASPTVGFWRSAAQDWRRLGHQARRQRIRACHLCLSVLVVLFSRAFAPRPRQRKEDGPRLLRAPCTCMQANKSTRRRHRLSASPPHYMHIGGGSSTASGKAPPLFLHISKHTECFITALRPLSG
ncbi:hypothetical protein MAPG_11057 [Magnaporthiopsis poae ATCC 64411]|uniref:Uncharacterized protein n=1 Tax=Magnaporthiopsis poae (strain ATCC 64411 / 73-15) TaxID=644358 RepID=A0A0C4EE90_MAGP6|nr:hypothetical protein MAPG_11057 [Magnaporthiopsis poae ATCC 64411]